MELELIEHNEIKNRYECVFYDTTETSRCRDCCGYTNFCGKYSSKTGRNPFEEILNRDVRRLKKYG